MQRFVEWHRLYLIFAYFCTVYRLTVTFGQLSKYSNIYRAGSAGREGTGATGTGQAPAAPKGLPRVLCARCTGVQLWRCRYGGAAVEVQAWSYRGAGVNVQAGCTRAMAGRTGSAAPLSASAAFWQSGCFSCRARVCSSAGEMRIMKGGQSKASGRVGGSWVSQEGLQASLPRHSSRITDSREEG